MGLKGPNIGEKDAFVVSVLVGWKEWVKAAAYGMNELTSPNKVDSMLKGKP